MIKVSDFLVSGVRDVVITTTGTTGSTYVEAGAGGANFSNAVASPSLVGTGAGTSGMVGIYQAFSPNFANNTTEQNTSGTCIKPFGATYGFFVPNPTGANAYYNNGAAFYNRKGALVWSFTPDTYQTFDKQSGYASTLGYCFDVETDSMFIVQACSKSNLLQYVDFALTEVNASDGTVITAHPIQTDVWTVAGFGDVELGRLINLSMTNGMTHTAMDATHIHFYFCTSDNGQSTSYGYRYGFCKVSLSRANGSVTVDYQPFLANGQSLPTNKWSYITADESLLVDLIHVSNAVDSTTARQDLGDLFLYFTYRHPTSGMTHGFERRLSRDIMEDFHVKFTGDVGASWTHRINLRTYSDNVYLCQYTQKTKQEYYGRRAWKRVDWDNWLKANLGIIA